MAGLRVTLGVFGASPSARAENRLETRTALRAHICNGDGTGILSMACKLQAAATSTRDSDDPGSFSFGWH